MSNDKFWRAEDYPPYMQMDAQKHNENVADGKPLCVRCQGTGNQLFSMYQKCNRCKGSGVEPENKPKSTHKRSK